MQFPLDTDFFTAGQDILVFFRLSLKLSTCTVKKFRAFHARILSMLFILPLKRLGGTFSNQVGTSLCGGYNLPP